MTVYPLIRIYCIPHIAMYMLHTIIAMHTIHTCAHPVYPVHPCVTLNVFYNNAILNLHTFLYLCNLNTLYDLGT